MVSTPASLLPSDEAARLVSLRYYHILDSLKEGPFDELVTLAARIFNLPIAYMSLVDEHEVSCKAVYGLPAIPSHPRAHTLCALAIKEGCALLFHDIATVPKTALNALAIQNALASNVRFYAGTLLRMPGQHAIGTLCLIGHQPRVFSSQEQEVLEYMAEIVSLTIAVRHTYLRPSSSGEGCWQTVHTQLQDEVYALGALVRYLAARYGTFVPVPQDILQPILRRLKDLCAILEEYHPC